MHEGLERSPGLADPERGGVDGVVHLDRYPLDRLDGTDGRCLVDTVRTALDTTGSAVLPGFLRPDAVDRIEAELAAAIPHVPIRRHRAGVYHRPDLPCDGRPPDDPRSMEQEWVAGHVTRDMIPSFAAAHRLYVSPLFKGFVAACVGAERVYEYADPLAGLVATVLPDGGRYPWHYDTNEFVVTIMITPPRQGGRFEFWPGLRRPGDENLDGLRRVLDGSDRSGVRSVSVARGDLQLFRGRYALHRVTEVVGPRHVLVLSYSDRPGVIGPVDRTRSIYGRVTEAHLVAAEAAATGPDELIL